MSGYRELTVADLIRKLAEMPQHYLVTVIVDGTAGIITDVWAQPLDDHGQDTPHVLIGEHDLAPQTVPESWMDVPPCP